MRTHLVLISLLGLSLIGCNPSVEPQAATQLNLLQGGQNMPTPRIESSLNKEDE